MKRLTTVIFIAMILLLSITACQRTQNGESNNSENSTSDSKVENNTADDNNNKITADIVKNGTLENMNIDTDYADISIVSWDLGYSGHQLTKGDEVLCIKYHVKNESDQTMEVGNIFHTEVYIDGVEIDGFGSDFYGDGRAFNVFTDTKLKPNAETDIYFCYECTVNDAHEVEIDIFDKNTYDEQFDIYFLSEEIIETFLFDIV